jgi:hypothetical protein
MTQGQERGGGSIDRIASPFAMLLLLFASLGSTTTFAQPLSCAPRGSTSPVSASGVADSEAYKIALRQWTDRLPDRRELEGASPSACRGPMWDVPGYKDFPVYECSYRSDGGDDGPRPRWPALHARVRVLDPSKEQLAAWTATACRDSGADGGDVLASCIQKTVNLIWTNNNAQFPVSGLVVERRCDVLKDQRKKCAGTPAHSHVRQPLMMSFRDGVTVASNALDNNTPSEELSDGTYDALFGESYDDVVAKSVSRVANAEREQWEHWRAVNDKPIEPDGVATGTIDLGHNGWLIVSREVHKAACNSDRNELILAVVRDLGFAKRPTR